MVHLVEVPLLQQLVIGRLRLLRKNHRLLQLVPQLLDLILQDLIFDFGIRDVLLGLDAFIPFSLSGKESTWKELRVLVIPCLVKKLRI